MVFFLSSSSAIQTSQLSPGFVNFPSCQPLHTWASALFLPTPLGPEVSALNQSNGWVPLPDDDTPEHDFWMVSKHCPLSNIPPLSSVRIIRILFPSIKTACFITSLRLCMQIVHSALQRALQMPVKDLPYWNLGP